jgi:hypothetical protein
MTEQSHLSGEIVLTATSDCSILSMQCYHYLVQNQYNFIVFKIYIYIFCDVYGGTRH